MIALAAVASAATVSAQVDTRDIGGLMMDKEIMMPSDLFELSQTQFNFGTARAMAMAGAFTSLGADASSMTINPAGLGMYRKSEITLTPMMTFARGKTNAPSWGRNSADRFAMSNVGIVINAYEGTGSLVSLNIGFGYNRIADLNYEYSSQRYGQGGTIADAFARQMVWSGRSKNSFYDDGGNGGWNWNRVPDQLLNAALAYRGFMIDQVDPDDPSTWKPTWIGPSADVGHFANLRSKGSVGEYAFSVGANINNKFYIGATLGIETIYQRKYLDYGEEYIYSTPSSKNPDYGVDPNLDYQLLWSKLNQSTIVDGTGVNFKLGMVYRPTDNLRLGVAIHSPTYYSVDYKFQSAAAALAYANRDTDPNVKPINGYISTDDDPYMISPQLIYDGPDSWSFVTPTRLMFGASYTFGQRGVISVDYERDWYNGIRLKDNPTPYDTQSFYNDTFRDQFKGSNIVRVGAEFKPLPMLSVRAGFGYSGSMLRNDDVILASPVIKQTTYYGAGLGWAISPSVVLDVAYQYMSSKTTDYYLYYVTEGNNYSESALYSADINRHNVALTLGFRF